MLGKDAKRMARAAKAAQTVLGEHHDSVVARPVAGAIEVKDLSKSFGSFRAVDHISFQARQGAITSLLGPSGSGKRIVLRMIAGLEQLDSGGTSSQPSPPAAGLVDALSAG